MKKKTKKYGIILFLCLWAFASLSVNASGKDVTKKMKKNSNFVKICKMFGNYTDCCLAEKRNKKTTKIDLSEKNQLSISAYIAYNYGAVYEYTEESIHNWTFLLFGTKPDVNLIPSDNSCFIRRTNSSKVPFKYNGGDWGDYKPGVTIKKVVKKAKGYYVVTLQNKLGSWESSKKTVLGTTKMVVRSNSSSALKFKVTKIITKGNGNGYF